MNGAELPNGSILYVEPAISKNSNDQNPSLQPEALTPEPDPVKDEGSNVTALHDQGLDKSDDPNDSDDLDEFFESL